MYRGNNECIRLSSYHRAFDGNPQSLVVCSCVQLTLPCFRKVRHEVLEDSSCLASPAVSQFAAHFMLYGVLVHSTLGTQRMPHDASRSVHCTWYISYFVRSLRSKCFPVRPTLTGRKKVIRHMPTKNTAHQSRLSRKDLTTPYISREFTLASLHTRSNIIRVLLTVSLAAWGLLRCEPSQPRPAETSTCRLGIFNAAQHSVHDGQQAMRSSGPFPPHHPFLLRLRHWFLQDHLPSSTSFPRLSLVVVALVQNSQ